MAVDTISESSVPKAETRHRAATPRELVVLTHGIASTKWILAPMAARLRRRGFDTHLHGYFSIRGSNRRLGEQFSTRLHELADRHPNRPIHVVAHSMGSIVTRCALLAGVPESMGRIVMIGPPNRGSHAARKLTPIYGWISNTLVELSDVPNSFVNRLPRTLGGHEVGIVAAARDNVVPADSTLLDDHRDHVTLNSLHTSILWRRRTANCVESFLRTGCFR